MQTFSEVNLLNLKINKGYIRKMNKTTFRHAVRNDSCRWPSSLLFTAECFHRLAIGKSAETQCTVQYMACNTTHLSYITDTIGDNSVKLTPAQMEKYWWWS